MTLYNTLYQRVSHVCMSMNKYYYCYYYYYYYFNHYHYCYYYYYYHKYLIMATRCCQHAIFTLECFAKPSVTVST